MVRCVHIGLCWTSDWVQVCSCTQTIEQESRCYPLHCGVNFNKLERRHTTTGKMEFNKDNGGFTLFFSFLSSVCVQTHGQDFFHTFRFLVVDVYLHSIQNSYTYSRFLYTSCVFVIFVFMSRTRMCPQHTCPAVHFCVFDTCCRSSPTTTLQNRVQTGLTFKTESISRLQNNKYSSVAKQHH